MAKTYTIQIAPALRGQSRLEASVEVDANSVQLITDLQLEQALFSAELRGTDDDRLFLRRETMRRAIEKRDDEAARDLVAKMIFEAVSSLFENADHRHPGPRDRFEGEIRHSFAAYDRDGNGIEFELGSSYVGNVEG